MGMGLREGQGVLAMGVPAPVDGLFLSRSFSVPVLVLVLVPSQGQGQGQGGRNESRFKE